jgi:hypothetical protein
MGGMMRALIKMEFCFCVLLMAVFPLFSRAESGANQNKQGNPYSSVAGTVSPASQVGEKKGRSFFSGKKGDSGKPLQNISKVRDGTRKLFYANGQIRMKAKMKKNDYHGKVVYWYANGKVKSKKYYHHGILNGRARTYYSNGNPHTDENYVMGIRKGKASYYFEDKECQARGPYDRDVPHGSWDYYHPTGELKMTMLYDYGQPTEMVTAEGQHVITPEAFAQRQAAQSPKGEFGDVR